MHLNQVRAVANIETLGLDLSLLDEDELKELMIKPEEMFDFDPEVGSAEAYINKRKIKNI